MAPTGNTDVMNALMQALALEAHLNMQYRRDWRVLKVGLGASKTAKKIKGFGHDVHYWQRKVTDMIVFLGGDPIFTLAAVTGQGAITEILQNELALENAITAPYEQFIQVAMKALDDETRNMFEHLIKWHHDHVSWLRTQLAIIASTSEGEYILENS